MTHPSFAEITDSTLRKKFYFESTFHSRVEIEFLESTYHHSHARCVYTRVSYHTVSSLQHTFHLAALSANRKTLYVLTEVAESSISLFPEKRISCIDIFSRHNVPNTKLILTFYTFRIPEIETNTLITEDF